MASEQTYTITELAREFDVTPRAIRFYEDQGLLKPSRAGRTRVYSKSDRTRLKLTLRGKRLGLSLAEIKELIEMPGGVGNLEQPQAAVQVMVDLRDIIALARADAVPGQVKDHIRRKRLDRRAGPLDLSQVATDDRHPPEEVVDAPWVAGLAHQQCDLAALIQQPPQQVGADVACGPG